MPRRRAASRVTAPLGQSANGHAGFFPGPGGIHGAALCRLGASPSVQPLSPFESEKTEEGDGARSLLVQASWPRAPGGCANAWMWSHKREINDFPKRLCGHEWCGSKRSRQGEEVLVALL